MSESKGENDCNACQGYHYLCNGKVPCEPTGQKHNHEWVRCGDCLPEEKAQEYTVGNAVRDLTSLGGYVLTKDRATRIINRLLQGYERRK